MTNDIQYHRTVGKICLMLQCRRISEQTAVQMISRAKSRAYRRWLLGFADANSKGE